MTSTDLTADVQQLLLQSRQPANSPAVQLSYATQALTLIQENSERHSQLSAMVLTRLGELQLDQQLFSNSSPRDFTASLTSFAESMSIFTSLLGADHEDVRNRHEALGQLFLERATIDTTLLPAALGEFQKALSAAQLNITNNPAAVLRLSSKVVSVLQQLGRYEDAFWMSKAVDCITAGANSLSVAASSPQREA